MSEEKLRRELEGAYRARAHIYRLIYEELAAEVGAAKAEQVLSRAMERRGRDASAGVFKPLDGKKDAVALGEFFVARSPDNGRLYPSSTEQRAGGISISV